MDNNAFARCLLAVLSDECEVDESFDPDGIRRVETYAEAGMLTTDAGLVVTMDDGSEFQLTIVQSRRGRDRGEQP